VLKDWHDRQFLESVEWDTAWQDSGRVFTREDGAPLRAAYILRALLGAGPAGRAAAHQVP
jgi:hypothetical protein